MRAISSWLSSKRKAASARSSTSCHEHRIGRARRDRDGGEHRLLELAGERELERVRVLEREPLELAVDEDVDGAPVGHARHREPRDVGERLLVVERAAEHPAGLGEERLPLLGELAVLDVGRRADPAVGGRQRPAEEPAVGPVGHPDPVLGVERRPRPAGLVPGCTRRGRILGVDEVLPDGRLVARQPGQLVPALVPVGDDAVGVGGPDDLRHRIRERAVAHLALVLGRGELLLGEERVPPPDLDRLLPELDEDGDLGAEDQRVERLHQVVDGAGAVAAEDVLGVLRDRGQEEDRDVLRPLPLLDQLGGLEAVHPRHLDVEQDRRELVVQQPPQRLLARRGADEIGVERLEDRLEREQVLGPVVDQQQLGPGGHGQHSP